MDHVAPLSRFAFLIGDWRCEARVKSADGAWQSLQGTWVGRFILDGHAIADEYRMTDPSGKLIVLGVNLRAYDSDTQTWNMKWLNGLAGTWVDLGPEELGGVNFDGQSISYVLEEPVAGHPYTRAPTRTSPNSTSRGEARNPATDRRGASSWWSRSIAPEHATVHAKGSVSRAFAPAPWHPRHRYAPLAP
jgi:hypothetical protein